MCLLALRDAVRAALRQPAVLPEGVPQSAGQVAASAGAPGVTGGCEGASARGRSVTGRLVVITGLPGSGKTSLALRLAGSMDAARMFGTSSSSGACGHVGSEMPCGASRRRSTSCGGASSLGTWRGGGGPVPSPVLSSRSGGSATNRPPMMSWRRTTRWADPRLRSIGSIRWRTQTSTGSAAGRLAERPSDGSGPADRRSPCAFAVEPAGSINTWCPQPTHLGGALRSKVEPMHRSRLC